MTQLSLPGLGIITDYHIFRKSLEFAQINSSLMQLEAFYKSCFPGVVNVFKVSNRKLQREGIDTGVEFMGSKIVYFDEKIRSKDYGDILLEEYSVWPNYPCINPPRRSQLMPVEIGEFEPVPLNYEQFLKPGWINGRKKTDYITYVVKPSRSVYFLPFLLLQRAWMNYHHTWLRRFGRKAAPNRTYHTSNVPIPVDVLYETLFETATWTV